MNRRLSFWDKLKAYKLTNNFYVLLLLTGSMLLSLGVYIFPPAGANAFVPELALAMATSLLASIFCLVSDVYVQYRNSEKDQLLEGMHEFGINNLHFNKQELLESLLPSCEKDLYLSGYRLILLDKIAPYLTEAARHGVQVRMVVSPPWHESFRLVYGDNEKVIDHYCRVFSALSQGCDDVKAQCQVRFINKPLFSDTYQVDHHLITGPYLHNKTVFDGRITASDFFTYDLVRKSRLYELVEAENSTLWEEAGEELDWDRFQEIYQDIRSSDYRESEKIELMRSACVKVSAREPAAAG